MTRFQHGHAMAAGILVGFLLGRHTFALVLCALAVGLILGRSWWRLGLVLEALRSRVEPRAVRRKRPW